jgi:hypothetical protein
MKKWLRNSVISMSIITIVIFAVGLTSSYAKKTKPPKSKPEIVLPAEIMQIATDLTSIAGTGNDSGLHPGSPRSDMAAAYIFNYLKKSGLQNVRKEPVQLVDGFAKESKVTVKAGLPAASLAIKIGRAHV